jgi:opacity protein-like surface antigen
MKKHLILFSVLAVILASPASKAVADSTAAGFRISFMDWQEEGLFDEKIKEDGVMFGPTLRFNFGQQEQFVLGLDAGYGSLGKLDRADFDLLLGYNLAPSIRIFADLRYFWQELDESASESLDRSIKTTGIGPGVGLEGSVPLGFSSVFLFGSIRIAPMQVKTDVEDADGTAVSWSYEAGIAYAWMVNTVAADSSMFLAAGYRHQQMKGGDFDERIQSPFLEFGFRQEF